MLERETTLKEIIQVLPAIKEIEILGFKMKDERRKYKKLKYQDSYDDYLNSEIRKTRFKSPIFFGLIIFLFTLSNIIESGGSEGELMFISLIVTIFITIKYGAKISYNLIYKRVADKANAPIKAYNNSIAPAVELKIMEISYIQQNKISELLSSTSIPSKYLTTPIINKFVDYIESYKADSFKECVNLLDQESKHNESLRRYSEIANQVKQVNKNLDTVSTQLNNLNSEQRGINQKLSEIEYKTRNM